MKIRYLGHSCFSITLDSGVTIVTDPYTKVGYELPKGIKADIVTVSHGHFDHSYIAAIGGGPAIVSEAGEYEADGLEIVGKESFHDPKGGALRGKNVIFTIIADGVRICHLGDLGEAYTAELTKKIGDVDVLLIPIGGTYTIDGTQAKEYVEKLQPNIVIPMHYLPDDGALDISDEKGFLSLFDEKNITRVGAEYTFTKKDIEGAKKKIVFMERN